MNTMIAYCGLDCAGCPIHMATLEMDSSKKQVIKESVSKLLFEHYGIQSAPEDINDCDGCRSDNGRIYSGCSHCKIRECAVGKLVESCAYCEYYYCDFLEKHFTVDPHSKKKLEEIRNLH